MEKLLNWENRKIINNINDGNDLKELDERIKILNKWRKVRKRI